MTIDDTLAPEYDELLDVVQPEPRRESAALTKLRGQLIHGEAIKDLPPPTPLIDGVLDLDTLAVLYGRSGAGKSFVALDWALSVATGSWWQGHAVRQGRVLYVVAEGAAGIGPRLDAWIRNAQMHRLVGEIDWLTAAPSLLEPSTRSALQTVAAEGGYGAIVLDTLARLIPGGDENSHATMSTVVEAADAIRRETGACVLLVHHTGKDASAGARGHTSLLGAVDTEIACDGAESVITLKATKQKHRADGNVIARLHLREVGDSCALVPFSGALEPSGDLTKSERVALETLERIAVPEGVSTSTWAECCEGEISRRTLFNARHRLLERGLIHQPAKARYLPTSASADASAEGCR